MLGKVPTGDTVCYWLGDTAEAACTAGAGRCRDRACCRSWALQKQHILSHTGERKTESQGEEQTKQNFLPAVSHQHLLLTKLIMPTDEGEILGEIFTGPILVCY